MRSRLDACVFWVVLRFEYASKLVVNAAWAFFKQCDRKHQLKNLRNEHTCVIFRHSSSMTLATWNYKLKINQWFENQELIGRRFVYRTWDWMGESGAGWWRQTFWLHVLWRLSEVFSTCWLAAVRYISEVCNLHNCQRGTCHCLVLSFKGKHCFVLKWNRSKQEHQGESSKGRNTKNTVVYVCIHTCSAFVLSGSGDGLFVVCFLGGFEFLVFASRSKTKTVSKNSSESCSTRWRHN